MPSAVPVGATGAETPSLAGAPCSVAAGAVWARGVAAVAAKEGHAHDHQEDEAEGGAEASHAAAGAGGVRFNGSMPMG
ncbi:hypothetical protein LVO79_01275 [Roseivivax marinus]|uniref:hypothetical protein n=1 Tax=Roseivivax marinus TaxID=1379903 RepID=UPI001F04AC3A|nr:hypothetical protein [Roseivivax marinus]UMA65139.1 hypothetical protein LVO79_01275 [Roseivivax marinus]